MLPLRQFSPCAEGRETPVWEKKKDCEGCLWQPCRDEHIRSQKQKQRRASEPLSLGLAHIWAADPAHPTEGSISAPPSQKSLQNPPRVCLLVDPIRFRLKSAHCWGRLFHSALSFRVPEATPRTFQALTFNHCFQSFVNGFYWIVINFDLQQIPQQFYCLGSITKENSLDAKQMNSGLQTLKGTAWHGVNATCLLNK